MPLVNKTFSDIITFDRASSATMFDSSGTLVYAPMNAIRNSSGVGAAAPSTLPTNWGTVQNGGSGITSTVAIGTEDEISYLDINISGTPSGSGSYQITFEPPATISALSGQTWTNSAFLKLSAGSFTNVGAIRFTTAEWTSAPAFIQNNQSVLPFPTNAALSTQRAAASITLSGGTTASIVPSITLTITSGQAISLTLRIGLPQLELGSVARTAVATSGTAYQGPRLDYDPATLAARGLLIEEQRTNLLTYSEDLSNAVWAFTGQLSFGSGSIVNDGVAPDGTTTADKVVEDTSTGAHLISYSNITTSTTSTSSLSFFIKAAGRTALSIRFGSQSIANRMQADINLNTGAITGVQNIGTATGATCTATLLPNQWWRITASVNPNDAAATAMRFLIYPNGTTNYTGDGVSGVYIWGAQVEAGAFPTSYIPTTTTALTRSADVASVNTLSPWFNATEGTLFGEAFWFGLTANDYYAALNDGTSSNLIGIGVGSTGSWRFLVTNVGNIEANISSGVVTANTVFKHSGAYKVNDFAACANGGSVGTDTSGVVPSGLTTLSLTASHLTTNQFNGYLRRITYYPRRLSNAELQAITA